jgi:segregation and condensation protein B
MADINQIKRIFEAALFGAGQPLALPQLAALFEEQDMPTHEEIARALEELQSDSAGRGVELVEVASGFRYQVREDVHPFVSRLWTERQTRYSRALLETLALIAYRQPITRAEIEQIRGVGVASSIVKTLEEREWVRVVGYRDLPGKPALFGTTKAFLDYFNLKSLDQLPPLSEVRDIEDIDPQLSLGGPETPRAPDEHDADGGDGTDTHGDTPHPGQHAPDPTTDEDAHAEEKMRDDTPEPAA